MKYYLDTEFYEDGKTIDLISIGVVCEDGREFYAVSKDAELHRVSEWVRTNVLPQLPPYGHPAWMHRSEIQHALYYFIVDEGKKRPEAWGYYPAYDWVVLCQLFGTMMDLPKHFPKLCMDLKQLAISVGSPPLPAQNSGKHDAIEDARWNMRVHQLLTAQRVKQ